jgi:hypothetical protein
LNTSNVLMFGTAYRLGGRLHFATAMSMVDFDNLVDVQQADKGSRIDQITGPDAKINRPREASHARDIGVYLDQTACQGHPFMFPSFMLNYGLHWDENQPKADIIIFAGRRETMAWPAIFSPPSGRKLPVTDGGHRSDEIRKKIAGGPGRLVENAVSVIFVMEDSETQYHQDFADCAKAKAISKSLSSAWDLRNAGNKFAGELVAGNGHLKSLVDATSNSVNLSTNSTKAWSMSAVTSATSAVFKDESGPRRLSDYFDHLFNKVPILQCLAAGSKPADYRKEPRGGCVLLRGVGIAVLMQAYSYAIANNVGLDKMADHMADVDWHVLKAGAPPQNGQDAHSYTQAHAQPIWMNMLAMMAGDTTFRIKGTRDAAETSFLAIRGQLNI